MSIINNTLLLGSGDEGYNLTRSLRFRASAGGHLSKTFSAAGDQKTFTISKWLKRGALGIDATFFASVTDANNFLLIYYQASTDKIIILGYSGGSAVINISTSAVFRDPSAWYHLVFAFDTTQATGSNRVKLYVNNTQQSVTFTNTPSLNLNALPSTTRYIGRAETAANYFDGYLTEVNFIDGQALTPSSFGETDLTTGVWKPKRYAGTYGTNGFYLPFTDNSALTTSSNAGLGKDFSGNGNYWTTNNISITSGVTYDSMTDVPTLTSATAANFAVANPVDQYLCTIAQGNLSVTTNNGGYGGGVRSTIAVSSGKWYWESVITALGGSAGQAPVVGIIPSTTPINAIGSNARYAYYGANGNKLSSAGSVSYGAAFTTGDVIGYALDLDAGTLTFYKNNTSQGTAFTGLSGSFCAAVYDPFTGGTTAVNFGQRPFAYTPPTGFVSLNTFNLPTSTIVKGNTVMDATLYTGTGAIQSIVNAGGFKPDLLWIKNRARTSFHDLVDSVRGVANGLSSNDTRAEISPSLVTSLNSNGFTLPANTTSDTFFTNLSGEAVVAWQWQAGQGTTSTNTNGSITSTVSVNATAGFSIVSYTGTGANANVGHGLGVAPQFIITKNRSAVTAWHCYVAAITNMQNGYIVLNSTAAFSTSTNTVWNGIQPTSSVFSVGTDAGPNGSGNAIIAYCFTPIAGYSAFGSYTGNGSTDGPFVYLGFRPKFVLWKNASATSVWVVLDTSRSPYNEAVTVLQPQSSGAEGNAANGYDLLSNGFKVRNTDVNWNQSGNTYIYMAFAENPFKNALAR